MNPKEQPNTSALEKATKHCLEKIAECDNPAHAADWSRAYYNLVTSEFFKRRIELDTGAQ